MLRGALLCLCLALLAGCGATRKISRVGVRTPASASLSAISSSRARLVAMTDIPKECPAEIRDTLASLAGERIEFPHCPEALEARTNAAFPFLNAEERSTMEEVLSSQCRSLGADESSLENFLATFDSSGPLGRRGGVIRSLLPMQNDLRALTDLRASLQDLVEDHLPLLRWARRNGQFVLAEDEVDAFAKLLSERRCDLSANVDQGYRAIRGLEDLHHALPSGPQRQRIEIFLNGLHKILDRQLKEFFPR